MAMYKLEIVKADPLAMHADAIRSLLKRTTSNIIEIGHHLTTCRGIIEERYGHGHYYKWLKAEFGMSDRTALHFTNVYEMSKSENFSGLDQIDLPISALYKLAAPSTPEAARTEIFERAKAGEIFSVAAVEEAIADTKAGEITDIKETIADAEEDEAEETAVDETDEVEQAPDEPPSFCAECDDILVRLRGLALAVPDQNSPILQRLLKTLTEAEDTLKSEIAHETQQRNR
jgi:hypothetical protein